MPNFNRSPSLPVEKIANAGILTLLIEMMVGVGLQRINRGWDLKNLRLLVRGGVAIFETILLVLLALFMSRLTLTRQASEAVTTECWGEFTDSAWPSHQVA